MIRSSCRDVWLTDRSPLAASNQSEYAPLCATLNLLPDRGFPIGTGKVQFFMYITTVSTGEPASCLVHEQLYHKWRYLARESGKALWAKAAKAGAFLPGLKLLGFPP
jgi:hypothetical protein